MDLRNSGLASFGVEICSFQDRGDTRSHFFRLLLQSSRLCLCVRSLDCPFRRQNALAVWEVVEALEIVAVPEIELEILGVALDILGKVHELAKGARLEIESARWFGVLDSNAFRLKSPKRTLPRSEGSNLLGRYLR